MKYLKLIYRIPEFLVYYLVELVRANFSIAYIIVSPTIQTKPEFLKVNLRLVSSAGIFLYSNLISMTPGTLSVDIDPERESILVHALIIRDRKKAMNDLEELQDRIKKMFD